MSWRAVGENIRTLGVLNGLLYLSHRALFRLTGERARVVRYYLVAQPVSSEPGRAIRTTRSSPVRQVDQNDPVVALFPRPPAVIEQRFASGSMCLVADVRDRFAGFIWLAFNGYDEDEVRCRYDFADPAHSVWDYDVYVEPEFRMGRTFSRLWDAANRELVTRGVRWTFSRISAFNAASMAAHRRMGMRRLFSATFFCVGPLQLAFLGTAPFLHLSLSERFRPVLMLPPPRQVAVKETT